MAKTCVVLEIGMGTDIRGTDPTKAACRALRDALWHNSLSIAQALGKTPDEMIVDVHIGVPRPEMVERSLFVFAHRSGRECVDSQGTRQRSSVADTANESRMAEYTSQRRHRRLVCRLELHPWPKEQS